MDRRKTTRSIFRRNALRFVLALSLLPLVTYGQATQSQANQLAASIARTKSGSFGGADVETILAAGAATAVLPSLEQQFARAIDVAQQGIIASALVRLGDKDNAYWNFLVKEATLAIDSDLPDPFHDPEWKFTDHQPSKELAAWAQAHHIEYGAAAQSAIYELPAKVLLLGKTGDPRGIPLLRRGLQSRNVVIVMTAAQSLAHIQDKDSIPLIIAACQRAPKDFASGIAEESLIFFDDSQAQAATDIYVPKDRAKVTRDARAHGLGPFGYK